MENSNNLVYVGLAHPCPNKSKSSCSNFRALEWTVEWARESAVEWH